MLYAHGRREREKLALESYFRCQPSGPELCGGCPAHLLGDLTGDARKALARKRKEKKAAEAAEMKAHRQKLAGIKKNTKAKVRLSQSLVPMRVCFARLGLHNADQSEQR